MHLSNAALRPEVITTCLRDVTLINVTIMLYICTVHCDVSYVKYYGSTRTWMRGDKLFRQRICEMKRINHIA